MKKLLALIMTLTMLLVSVSAFAESAYTYTEYTYDESLFAEIGGEWLGLEELGLMLYLPDIYLPAEIPEVLLNAGTIALYATADGISVLNFAYGPAVNTAGASAVSVEELAAYYASVVDTAIAANGQLW